MRKAKVYRNKELLGYLVEEDRENYVFKYDDTWLMDKNKPSVSLTLPKSHKEYRSKYLFPFFFNMLSEGANKDLQIKQLRIDPNDDFGLLLATAQYDTLGAITIKPEETN
ncbi:MAG: phosphatidylinositol kinase [Candidatus Delongbacteria bacterium]|nr:phosphatidylinositol kinase [Candidatus Delongbacteria bacterium]